MIDFVIKQVKKGRGASEMYLASFNYAEMGEGTFGVEPTIRGINIAVPA